VLEQLTTDHSLVAELVRTGRLTEAEAAVHPHRSVITRALGTEAEVEVDTRTLELAPGDLILLCSDGLSAMVRDDDIARLLGDSDLDPYQAAETLVRAANAAGGEDNVTVVVFEVIQGTPRATTPAAPDARHEGAPTAGPDDVTSESALDGVQRHGAGKGSRWPALLLILAILAVAALAIWWTFLR
jgi:protein phosphatase